MCIDHKGQAYSIATDDEERFDYLIKQIKTALKQQETVIAAAYESLLNHEFSKDLFKNRSS